MSYTASDWKCWRVAEHYVNETIYGWPQCFECGAAPPYHERSEFVRDDFALGIYVLLDHPLKGAIAPHSGIVGLHNGGVGEDSKVELYFEGWTNGPMQYADRDVRGLWEAGVAVAANRMITRYPTVATCVAPNTALQGVGLFQVKTNTIIVDNEQALAAWLEA